MSRIGKIPIKVPKEVKTTMDQDAITIEGPKGKLSLSIPAGILVEQNDDSLVIKRAANTKQFRSNHGTMRALIWNMIVGVTKEHKKELEIQGVGFRAQLQGNKLTINLGFSHPVEFEVPKEVKVSVPKPTSIIVEGNDKMMVGEVAARIRSLKKPEPYKGKGIRYVDEYVRRKQGKSVTK